MLTDDQARGLLHDAADTIDVGPAGSFAVSPRRRTWPVLVAAAAIVAVVATTAVVNNSGEAPTTDPAPTLPTVPQLDADQIPSVIGLDVAEAEDLLVARGLVVEREWVQSCYAPQTGALGTHPALGTRFHVGDVVRLVVSRGTDYLCVQDSSSSWNLLRFARGIGPTPQLAQEVTLYAAGTYETRAGVELADDPDSWTICTDDRCESALVALAADAETPWPRDNESFVAPYLSTQHVAGGEDPFCGFTALAPELESRARLAVGLEIPTDGPDLCTRRVEVDLFLDDKQAIDTVVLREKAPLDEASDAPREPTHTQRRIAERLMAFARGGDLPPVADEIDLYNSNANHKRISSEAARDRDSWATHCDLDINLGALSTSRCFLSVLHYAAMRPAVITGPLVRTNGACHVVQAELPAELTTEEALADAVSFGVPEPETCADNWEVQLWLDDEDRIYAVNLILGSPDATD